MGLINIYNCFIKFDIKFKDDILDIKGIFSNVENNFLKINNISLYKSNSIVTTLIQALENVIQLLADYVKVFLLWFINYFIDYVLDELSVYTLAILF